MKRSCTILIILVAFGIFVPVPGTLAQSPTWEVQQVPPAPPTNQPGWKLVFKSGVVDRWASDPQAAPMTQAEKDAEEYSKLIQAEALAELQRRGIAPGARSALPFVETYEFDGFPPRDLKALMEQAYGAAKKLLAAKQQQQQQPPPPAPPAPAVTGSPGSLDELIQNVSKVSPKDIPIATDSKTDPTKPIGATAAPTGAAAPAASPKTKTAAPQADTAAETTSKLKRSDKLHIEILNRPKRTK